MDGKRCSPHNVALVKDLELTDTVITFQVKSTRDTGGSFDDMNEFTDVKILGRKADAGK